MKTKWVFAVALAAAIAASGQESDPRATGSVWLDIGGSQKGLIAIPQYKWVVKVPGGKLSGFGFAEVAPGERLFNNHSVSWTPNRVSWFSARVEIGGKPAHGAWFVQLGPQINLTKVVPGLEKYGSVNAAFLSGAVAGKNSANLMFGGRTKSVHLSNRVSVNVEAFGRAFTDGKVYGEVLVPVAIKCRFLRHAIPAFHAVPATATYSLVWRVK